VAWFEVYRDPVLTGLISTALTNAFEVRLAATRVEEAAAAYRVQRSALFPTLTGAGSWSRARVGDIPPAPGVTTGQFDVFGQLSYELDFWGRLRGLSAAGRARYLATEEARRVVRMGLISQVAVTYFQLRALDRQLEIARETLLSRTSLLEVVKARFAEENGLGFGIVSELDVRQAETQVHAASASIARLERSVALAENALNLLMGRPPGPVSRGPALTEQVQPAGIPAGLPSALLLRRPDLQAAESQLAAARADVVVARAAYFPTVSLTAALGVQSVELEDLFSGGTSRAWRFVPQVAGPIFNAGRIRAGVRTARAREVAALVGYEQAIQSAFREVEDALVSVRWLRKQLAAEEAAVRAEQRRLALSRLRYEAGVASFSDVLDAERFLFSAELSAVQTRADVLVAVAQLYRALGGGWDAGTEPATVPQPAGR
jgi:multidrug efflux system outer membrane protein